MGAYDIRAEQMSRSPSRSAGQVVVIASPERFDDLGLPSKKDAFPVLELVHRMPSDEIETDALKSAAIAVVEVDPVESASIARLASLRERYPSLPLVAAIEGASVSLVRTLVRQGIADVVSLPFDINDLMQVMLDVSARSEATARVETALAPVFAVARSIGGCGTTSIATHLAADLARNEPAGRGTVIVDLDLQFGAVADFLGVSGRGSVADLLGAGARLDEELVRSIAGDAGSGLAVISAPDAIVPLETVDADDLLKVIQLLRRQYDHVVIDLPANWTSWTLSAALAADVVLLVTELSVTSLRQAKRRLELFRSVGIDDRHIEVVVNRVEKRLFRTIGLDDVATTLNHSVLASVALEAPALGAAQTQGLLVGDVQAKSRFAADIHRLASILRDRKFQTGE